MRSRHWSAVLCVIGVCGLLIVACGQFSYTLDPRHGYLVGAASQVPVIAAVTIQASLASVLGRKERQAARQLRVWRLLHIVLLSVVAAAVAAVAALFIQPPANVLLNGLAPLGPVALARDVLAFTGAALLGATLFGPAFGWSLPLAWAILPATALTGSNADPTGLLRLAAQPDGAIGALIASIAIWGLGAWLGTVGTRVDLRRVQGRAP